MQHEVSKEKQEVGTVLSKNEDGTCTIQMNMENPLVLDMLGAHVQGGIVAVNEVLHTAQESKSN